MFDIFSNICMIVYMENGTTKTRKTNRRSKCAFCAQSITEKQVIKATDASDYINAYSAEDNELVWIGKDGHAMCYGQHFGSYHYTQAEWDEAQ